jgi:hypothetical protein
MGVASPFTPFVRSTPLFTLERPASAAGRINVAKHRPSAEAPGHIGSVLSGIFSHARNEGAFAGVNLVQGV